MKINYLFPILATHDDIEYICFVDYIKDKVFFINQNIEENIKKELTYEILRSVNNKSLVDRDDINNKNNQALKIVSHIMNTKIKKALEESFGDQKNE